MISGRSAICWLTEWLTKNKDERLYEVFHSDRVITLDELPDFDL